MGHASWQDLPDLGAMDYCNSISEDSNYVMSNFNITCIPATFRFGLCLPKQCNQHEFNYAGYTITNSLNKFIVSLFSNSAMSPGQKRKPYETLSSDEAEIVGDPILSAKDFYVDFFYRDIADYVGSWLSGVRPYMIVTVIAICLAIATLLVISVIAYATLKQSRIRQQEENTLQDLNPPRSETRAFAEQSTNDMTISRMRDATQTSAQRIQNLSQISEGQPEAEADQGERFQKPKNKWELAQQCSL